MKMEHVVKAPFAGVMVKLTSRPGDIVEDGRALASVQRK
jgi:biotin carboxyl carrier protein